VCFGHVFGVCHEVAARFGLSVWVVQAAAILLALVIHIVPFLVLYFAAAMFMDTKDRCDCINAPKHSAPRRRFWAPDVQPFSRPADSSPKAASWNEIKDVMAKLDHRIQRMESVVTSREYDWDRRLNT
jgi:phage shock protein C